MTPTASRPPQALQGHVRTELSADDERKVKVLGAAIGIAATLGLAAIAWSLL